MKENWRDEAAERKNTIAVQSCDGHYDETAGV